MATNQGQALSGNRPRVLTRVDGGAQEPMLDPRLVVASDPMGTAAEQYRVLLYKLRYLRSQRPVQLGAATTAITSAVRGEGASLTAANLALAAARAGETRVALIDCDLRRGSQAKLFGLSSEAGVSDLLMGRCEIGDALGRVGEGDLAVLTAGTPVGEPAALLGSQRFTSLLASLRNLFDEIYLDVPAALATAEGPLVAHRCDGAVMVVRAGSTPREQVDAGLRALAGTQLFGVVLNEVDPGRVPAPLTAPASMRLLGR